MGKSFVVTPKNIKHYSSDMLVKRYRSLIRTMKKKEEIYDPLELGESYAKLRDESQLIFTFMANKQAEHLLAEQMTFPGMENPSRNEYVALVKKKLSDHYIRLQRIEELEKKLAEGVQIFIPSSSCVASYGGEGGGRSSNQSVSERLIIQADTIERNWEIELEDTKLRIQPMLRALQQLDEDERLIIEHKFLQSINPKKDIVVIQETHIARRTYYEKKPDALFKLADALSLI